MYKRHWSTSKSKTYTRIQENGIATCCMASNMKGDLSGALKYKPEPANLILHGTYSKNANLRMMSRSAVGEAIE